MDSKLKEAIKASIYRCFNNDRKKCNGSRFKVEKELQTDMCTIWNVYDKHIEKSFVVKQSIFKEKSRLQIKEL